MKAFGFIISIVVALIACEFPNSENDNSLIDLSAGKLDSVEMWVQVGVRFPSSGGIVPVTIDSAVTLQINGSELLFGLLGKYCKGSISEASFNLDSSYHLSPYWIITERKIDTMYIYPRLGVMYYSDLVMKKVTAGCTENCALQPMTGPCDALFPKYYFDKSEGKCKKFTWGGCNGVVPFQTLEECEACKCQNSSVD